MQNKLDVSGQEYLIAGDAEGYWELAKSIVHREDYAVHSPPRYVHRMPGFPAILAVSITLFGENRFAARLFLATWGAFACWLVYLLGRRLHSEQAGLIAAGLAAISPAAIGFSGLILSETSFSVALLLSLLGIHGLITEVERSTPHPALDPMPQRENKLETLRRSEILYLKSLLVGLGIACCVYLKPSWILIGPLFVFILLFLYKPGKRHLMVGALVLLGMWGSLLPWGMRNEVVSGHFTLTTFWMGPSLYDGLNSRATGDSDMRFFDEDQLPLVMSEYEVDQEYKRRAVEFVRTNPGRVVELAVLKLWRYWKPTPSADQFQQLALRSVLCLYTLPVFALALIGAWQVHRQFWTIAICAGPIFYFSGLHLVFVSSLRYRLPAEGPLLVLSAIGVLALAGMRQRRINTD